MGLFDKPFGVQVGPFGASSTASELGDVILNEQKKYQLQKMLQLYKLNDLIGQGVQGLKQVPGAAYQAMPSFKIDTPVGSFEKPSGSSLLGATEKPEKADPGFAPRPTTATPLGGGVTGKVELPPKPGASPNALGAQQSDYARLLDKFTTQGRVSSAGPGMYKIMGPNGTPHYVTENQLYSNLQELDKGWDEKLAGAKDESWHPPMNLPGTPDSMPTRPIPMSGLMPTGTGPGKVPGGTPIDLSKGMPQTGTPKPENRDGEPWWMKALQAAGPLAGEISRQMSAPGNERPFAQMGYLKEQGRIDELQAQKDAERMRTESAWARSQAEIGAELERQRMANEAAMERQKAEAEAQWQRTQAEIASREKIYADKDHDITITPEMAAKLGGPWAAMVGQKIPASVLGQSIGYQATQSGYMDRLERQQMLTDYEAVQKALLDPRVTMLLSPEEIQQLRQKKDWMERNLFPDMQPPGAPQGVPQGGMQTPPPAAPAQAEGPGFVDKLLQSGRNAWNWMSSGGQTDPNAAVGQAPPPPQAPPQNPFGELPVSQSTKQTLLGIQQKHGSDPVALRQALEKLAQSVSPQEREEILKLLAQVKR